MRCNTSPQKPNGIRNDFKFDRFNIFQVVFFTCQKVALCYGNCLVILHSYIQDICHAEYSYYNGMQNIVIITE